MSYHMLNQVTLVVVTVQSTNEFVCVVRVSVSFKRALNSKNAGEEFLRVRVIDMRKTKVRFW